jgi:hypothetical protein
MKSVHLTGAASPGSAEARFVFDGVANMLRFAEALETGNPLLVERATR